MNKFYDSMATINSILSRACFDVSRACSRAKMPKAAACMFNAGNRRATVMLKYWIKAMDAEDCSDVKVL